MPVINGADYLSISNDLANARDTIVSAQQDLFDAVYKVVMLQVIMPEVDLLNDFWQTYVSNVELLTSPTNILPAVSSLQQHVVERSTSGTVNGYIFNNVWPNLLDPTFYDLSARAGYDIDASYVDWS